MLIIIPKSQKIEYLNIYFDLLKKSQRILKIAYKLLKNIFI